MTIANANQGTSTRETAFKQVIRHIVVSPRVALYAADLEYDEMTEIAPVTTLKGHNAGCVNPHWLLEPSDTKGTKVIGVCKGCGALKQYSKKIAYPRD